MPNKSTNGSEQFSLFRKVKKTRAKGPRLWLKPAYDGQQSVWIIRDTEGNKQISTGFREHQKRAAAMVLMQYIAKKEAAAAPQRCTSVSTISVRFYEARRRAAKIGKPFDLTPEFLDRLLAAQGDRCALTGIPFEEPVKGRNNPFVMSLDRIDSQGGYTQDNVRLVIFAMNAALGPWGEDVFRQVAAAYLDRIEQQQAA
jgi:hypothetical protein